ncbi:MAG TPA: hypothetical protein ENJ09_05150 [Planctomycetes bacterium]|nr:hypothetical protein [Planctomycetota bacterium]
MGFDVRRSALLALPFAALAACSSLPSAPTQPLPSGTPADELIQPGEKHFAHLWKLTSYGENAEGYFSFDGRQLSFQRRNPAEGVECDRIYLLGENQTYIPVSDGTGVTTCAYFLPGDEEVLYASTRASSSDCPPRPDYSRGYVWPILAGYDIWIRNLTTGELRPFVNSDGYDAEATVSPLGDRIVFTSTRSGDLELWTCDLDGSNLVQVTDTLGYDGGGFFSHDGKRIVFRATAFDPDKLEEQQADYTALLADGLVRPSHMELMVIDADGSNRRQITNLGGANFAPFFYPDDSRVIFSTNHHDPRGRDFDIYAVNVDGSDIERITTFDGFDSFPIFDPTGRYLVFASNRGGESEHTTNLFIAEWR